MRRHSLDVMMTKVAMNAYGLQVVDRAQTPQQFEFGMTANLGWAHKPLKLQLNDINMGRQEAPFTLIEQQVTLDLGFYLGRRRAGPGARCANGRAAGPGTGPRGGPIAETGGGAGAGWGELLRCGRCR